MKVFISWSGPLSHKVALILKKYLKSIIQSLELYVSSEDIDKGTRWGQEISTELNTSRYGIICATKENISSQWINFEAGALSKEMDNSKVCPLLINLDRAEVTGPLVLFQSTLFDKEDFKRLVVTLNEQNDTPLEKDLISTTYDMFWPQLDLEVRSVIEQNQENKEDSKKRPVPDLIEEVLFIVREQSRILQKMSREDMNNNSKIMLESRFEKNQFKNKIGSIFEIEEIADSIKIIAELATNFNEKLYLIKEITSYTGDFNNIHSEISPLLEHAFMDNQKLLTQIKDMHNRLLKYHKTLKDEENDLRRWIKYQKG